jgi:hypothetical protein
MTDKPPFDSALFKKVVARHLFEFISLFALGMVFVFMGGGFAYYFTGIPVKIFGCIFVSAGLGILVFDFVSNISSVRYYYEQGMLKKHGLEILAKITEKHVAEFRERKRTSREVLAVERDLRIGFRYSFNLVSYDSECILDKQALYESLEIGQEIPVLILPYKPDVAYPRIGKLTSRMKLKNSRPVAEPDDNAVVSESLMDEDDIP